MIVNVNYIPNKYTTTDMLVLHDDKDEDWDLQV
jgi:hypothetical protein